MSFLARTSCKDFETANLITSYHSSLCSHSTKCDNIGVSVATGNSTRGYSALTFGVSPAKYNLKQKNQMLALCTFIVEAVFRVLATNLLGYATLNNILFKSKQSVVPEQITRLHEIH